ncbi:hypothetical protein K443DRAFT_3861 [Laccaria amethystina LaAM-08-1]|uniref:Unplaced genomic scaffold K443scaffold_25, whole genome shotgun sequence n=1 Tax=Laccaria amethystina LaAM-08-1 TaxID=1095629 RepID=A0A0C9XUR6_9AGAR|nr:hypothetical protein K443DRAFT_3861 [Laccaria amethystina LaAM-08-1]
MAKAATTKAKGSTHAKAPMKAAPKKAAPKKTPATQRRNTGMQKQPAEDDSSEESPEELNHRQHKKKWTRPTEASDDEVVEAGDKDDKEPEVVGGEPESGHESLTDPEGDGLHDPHRILIPSMVQSKKDLARDVQLIFTDPIKVKVVLKDNRVETLSGRWCNICKNDVEFVKRHGKRKAFHTGSNSSCRQHIRQHYKVYRKRCKEANLPEHHWAIPRIIWKQMEEERTGKDVARQGTLDGFVGKEVGPVVYTHENTLHMVTQFIAVDDQSLSVANKTTHLHNEFVRWLVQLKVDIETAPGLISTTTDMWSADTTKAAFLGVTAHWINVKRKEGEEMWEMHSEVISFRSVSTLLPSTTHQATPQNAKILKRPTYNETFPRGLQTRISFCHVVNLVEVDVMTHITKIAAVETATAIWEYDPSLPDNHVLNGSLDVAAAIRTLAIKIQSSGQHIKVLAVPPLFLQESGHSGGMKFGREAC